MRVHPIRVAFEHVDVTASPTFRDELRARFLAAIAQPEAAGEVMVDVVERTRIDGLARGETEPTSSKPRGAKVVLAIAAAVALVVAVTVLLVGHDEGTKTIDTSHDLAVAEAAIISPASLGYLWEISHRYDYPDSREIADIAATVPDCTPYVDVVFDSPRRQAVTTGQHFELDSFFVWTVSEWVTLFPSEAAASRMMDMVAEHEFAPCFDRVFEGMYPAGKVTRLDALPVAPHGDRQVVLGQRINFGTGDIGPFVNAMNVWVQIGRAVVFVDPSTEFHDSLDPGSRIERAVSAATEALQAALKNAD